MLRYADLEEAIRYACEAGLSTAARRLHVQASRAQRPRLQHPNCFVRISQSVQKFAVHLQSIASLARSISWPCSIFTRCRQSCVPTFWD